jgi:hypothetical protein
VSTPRHPQTGQFVNVVSGAPRTGSFESVTGTGATDTASAPPPVFAQPPDLPTQASGDDQAAFKLAWQAKMSPTGHSGPGPADSSVPGDGLPGFSGLPPGRT